MAKARIIEAGGALYLEADVDRDWAVRYRLEYARRRIVFADVHVFPRGGRTPAHGITPNVLRTVTVGAHRRALRDEWALHAAQRMADDLGVEHGELRSLLETMLAARNDDSTPTLSLDTFDLDALRPRRERGRRKSEHWFAEVARFYAAIVATGSTRPIPLMAQMMGLAHATVSGAVRDARKRGYLTSTRGGRAGGRLTARAERLLDDEKKED